MIQREFGEDGETVENLASLAQLVVGERADVVALAEYAEHAADPDHLVTRWRKTRFIASLQGKDQWRAMQAFGLDNTHADHRAFRRHGQFHHLAINPVHLGKVGFCATGCDFLLLFLFAGPQAWSQEGEIAESDQQQRYADGRNREQ